MPLRTLLPSAPGLGLSHRRYSTVDEEAASIPTVTPLPTRARTRGNSLKRLSLTLSRTNEEPFPALLTQEAARVSLSRPATQPGPASKNVEQSNSAGTPTALSNKKDAEVQRKNPHDDLSDLPLPKLNRLSLLGARYASDPQLSSRFRKEERKSPVDARTCSFLLSVIAVTDYLTSPQDNHDRAHHE
jgi:hypothetical protein